jgi:hypothetical protein
LLRISSVIFFLGRNCISVFKSIRGFGCILEWRRLRLTEAGLRYRPFRAHWFHSFPLTHVVCCGVYTLFYCALFWVRSRAYGVLVSIYNSKISSTGSLMFLLQVVQTVTTTWTTGGRVGVLFSLSFKHYGMRYSSLSDNHPDTSYWTLDVYNLFISRTVVADCQPWLS